MKNWWISWYGHPVVGFELNTPWWYTGQRGDGIPTICAAVKAEDEDAAQTAVIAAHGEPVSLEWRFVEERSDDWSPFNDRFRKAEWMQWT